MIVPKKFNINSACCQKHMLTFCHNRSTKYKIINLTWCDVHVWTLHRQARENIFYASIFIQNKPNLNFTIDSRSEDRLKRVGMHSQAHKRADILFLVLLQNRGWSKFWKEKVSQHFQTKKDETLLLLDRSFLQMTKAGEARQGLSCTYFNCTQLWQWRPPEL